MDRTMPPTDVERQQRVASQAAQELDAVLGLMRLQLGDAVSAATIFVLNVYKNAVDHCDNPASTREFVEHVGKVMLALSMLPTDVWQDTVQKMQAQNPHFKRTVN